MQSLGSQLIPQSVASNMCGNTAVTYSGDKAADPSRSKTHSNGGFHRQETEVYVEVMVSMTESKHLVLFRH